jgi:hypothetical protein
MGEGEAAPALEEEIPAEPFALLRPRTAVIQFRHLTHERAGLGMELPANAAPVPAEFMIAAGAGDVQEDASETGLSKLCLSGAICGGGQ